MSEILDSGERREFESGAVRDIVAGKGRCDLLPLTAIAPLMGTAESASVIMYIGNFVESGDARNLYTAIQCFNNIIGWTDIESIMEVAHHYEEGADKYGERNWEKGISLHSFIDSGLRHFFKFLENWEDERHDRAFLWNMLGAIWTMTHRPECIDIDFESLKPSTADEGKG